MLITFLKQEIKRKIAGLNEVLIPTGFCLLVVSLIAFGIGTDPELLKSVSIGIVWVAIILSSLLALPELFEKDHSGGILEQEMLLPIGQEWLIFAKGIIHIAARIIPLIIIGGLSSLLLYYPIGNLAILMFSFVLGAGIITFISILIASLVVGAAKGGAVIGVILLPLYIPVVIFASLAAAKGMGSAEMELLLALFIASPPICCWLAAAVIKRAI